MTWIWGSRVMTWWFQGELGKEFVDSLISSRGAFLGTTKAGGRHPD